MDRALWAILFAAIIAFGAWARIVNPPVLKRSPDELVYVRYAQLAAADPLNAPRRLVATFNASPGNWIYPIPLRVAYYYTIAALSGLFHLPADKAGVALSTACSILQLLMVALFGLRFFHRWTALIAVALLSVSPQDLAMARRIWGDGVSGCVAMIFLWLCAEISIRKSARLWYIPLWICGAYLLLLKESGGFYFGFCVLGLALQSWLRTRSWKNVASIALGAFATAACSFILMASLCGGASAALETVRHSAQSAPLNEYGALFQSGPWYSFPLGLFILSPLSGIGCATALVILCARRRPDLAHALAALIILVLIVATLPPALKNLRYISFIIGPWYLMAAYGLAAITKYLRQLPSGRTAPFVVAVAILLSCFSDYARFDDLFIRRAIPDLNIRQIATSPFAQES